MPGNGGQRAPSSVSDDTRLVARVIGGDRRALRRFVDCYLPIVRAFLIRRMRLRAADADDVTQQLFERLWRDRWRALRMWRGDDLGAYLRGIAHNLAVDFLRARGRMATAGDDPKEDPAQGVVALEPEQEQFQQELRRAVEDCLGRAHERDRILVWRFHFDGRSYREIGEELRLTIGAVGVALHRAEARLRRCLQRLHPGVRALFGSDGV